MRKKIELLETEGVRIGADDRIDPNCLFTF